MASDSQRGECAAFMLGGLAERREHRVLQVGRHVQEAKHL